MSQVLSQITFSSPKTFQSCLQYLDFINLFSYLVRKYDKELNVFIQIQ